MASMVGNNFNYSEAFKILIGTAALGTPCWHPLLSSMSGWPSLIKPSFIELCVGVKRDCQNVGIRLEFVQESYSVTNWFVHQLLDSFGNLIVCTSQSPMHTWSHEKGPIYVRKLSL